jgi:hypothetical protein
MKPKSRTIIQRKKSMLVRRLPARLVILSMMITPLPPTFDSSSSAGEAFQLSSASLVINILVQPKLGTYMMVVFRLVMF